MDFIPATIIPSARAGMIKPYIFHLQKVFVDKGGVVKDNQKVTNITPGEVVRVQTETAVHLGKKVIITAGPWANLLLNPLGINLPLQVNILL